MNKILVVFVLMFSIILPINTLSSLGVSEAFGLDLIVGLVFWITSFAVQGTIQKWRNQLCCRRIVKKIVKNYQEYHILAFQTQNMQKRP